MKRTERHFKIITFLRGRRQAVTAERIAQEYEVSTRTIYRDIQDMMGAGVPIAGEAGVGYMLDSAYHLAPLSFDVEEIESLVLGMSMVGNWTDETMARSARSALDKIKNALPEASLNALFETALFSFRGRMHIPWTIDFSEIRKSIRGKKKLALDYADEKGAKSIRHVRPLALVFFGPTWLLLAWCEKRNDFRNFRIDRISNMEILLETFRNEPGKTLKDYKKACGTPIK